MGAAGAYIDEIVVHVQIGPKTLSALTLSDLDDVTIAYSCQ